MFRSLDPKHFVSQKIDATLHLCWDEFMEEQPIQSFHYSHWIRTELELRRARNPAYSLRSFARDLKVNVSVLSQVLSGQRNISKPNALKLAEALALSPAQKSTMLQQIQSSKNKDADVEPWHQLSEDEFYLLSDWHYLAILNLAKLKTNRSQPKWIAKRLGLTEEAAKEALDRLQRLGYLKVTKGQMVRTAQPLRTKTDIPSRALRKHQHQILQMAAHSLERDAVDTRDMGSVTMAVNKKQLKKAKALILKFKKDLVQLMEKGTKDDVYALSVQLFPLTSPKQGPKK